MDEQTESIVTVIGSLGKSVIGSLGNLLTSDIPILDEELTSDIHILDEEHGSDLKQHLNGIDNNVEPEAIVDLTDMEVKVLYLLIYHTVWTTGETFNDLNDIHILDEEHGSNLIVYLGKSVIG